VILGPGDWSKSSAQLFSTVKNGLKFYTNGSNGYVDVRDVATIMHQLMKSNLHSERYILSGENLSYKTLFEEMATALGVAPPSILAGKFLSELSWRILAVWAAISGQSPLITKETAKSANDHYRYSSKKICQVLNFNFTPIKQTIQHTANAYLGQIKPHV
jgi:nucleoside-diphosphate-sugar epimerase